MKSGYIEEETCKPAKERVEEEQPGLSIWWARAVDVWLRHLRATEGKVVWADWMSFRDVARFSMPVRSYTLSRILDAIQPRCLPGVVSNLN